MHANNRWLILAMISSALFLIIIDMTVLYTALPRLTTALEASASEKLWIVNAYPLVVAGLLPGAGMLSDRIGHKTMFIAGLPTFAVASLCAAFAPSAAMLIAARAFLAIGAAMMMPATLSIVRHVFTEPGERALAIGIWSAVASGGAAVGPVVGGILLEYFWWGSVFLINVPVVLLVLPLAWRLIPQSGGNNRRPFDVTGSLQIMVGLVSSIYALKELSKTQPSLPILALSAALGLLFLTLFARRQRRATSPMIDFTLFSNRLFASGVAVAVISMVALVGIELVLSQRLQLVNGLSPLQAGLFILPIPLASALSGPLAGLLLPRWGERRLILGGLLLTTLAVAGLIGCYHGAALWQLTLLFAAGFGLGAAITAASTAIMLNAPEEKSGMAASIEDVAYELGSVLGITLLGGLMTVVYSYSLLLPADLPVTPLAYDSLDEALRQAGELSAAQGATLINLARASFDQAFIAVLAAAAALMAIGAAVLSRAMKK